MDTEVQTVDLAHTIRTPEQAVEALWRVLNPTSGSDLAPGKESKSVQAQRGETVVSDFVNIVKSSPKVWAICADQDTAGVFHIWTYVDSIDRRDRSAVYRAEWQMLTSHPDVLFDFNVVLLPMVKGQYEIEEADCVYRR